MTKIIDRLEEKVNESAFSLFAKKGYSGVTMKMVAEDVGISVGTLYNYYSNKQDLFISVFKKVFDQIYVTLESMIGKNTDSYEFLSILYEEIVSLQGFSRELLRDKINHEAIDKIKEHLMALMRSLLYKAKETGVVNIPDRDKDRTIRMLLLAIHDFSREYPDDREGNIEFFCRLIRRSK
jgi:AcrR family transcriptional regulator